LRVAFGLKVILDGVSLSIEPGERIGVVGRNGGGKSTMMKVLAGVMQPDSGNVQLARGSKAGYLTQDPVLTPGETLRGEAESAFAELHRLHLELNKVFEQMAHAEGADLERLMERQGRLEGQIEAAGGHAVDHKIDAVLHGLGFTDGQFGTPVEGLSGGQKGRLSLAKMLLQQPDVLLLDEPTNHLDIDGRLWLENFLVNEFRGAVLVISHDRYLLDNVVHRIVEVEQARLIDYPGNYEAFMEIRAQRRLSQMRAFTNEQTKFKKEEAFIRRYRAGQRAKQAQGRLSKLTRAKEESTLERPAELASFRLELPKAPRTGDLVVTARGISKGYDGEDGTRKQLFTQLDLLIGRGERWGIVGPNGAGKSTLVRVLLGEQPADEGSVRIGSNVVVGHYKQTHEHLMMEKTVVRYLQDVILKECPGQVLSEQQARNLAGAFLFSGSEQDRELGSLSGGERSRAVLAGLLASAKNLLVLDEPTNHLDIPSAERLEEALAPPDEETGEDGYEGVLILISHDRALIDSTCDHLLILDGHGGAEAFVGSWSEWREKSLAREKEKRDAEIAEKARREKAEADRKAAEERKKAQQLQQQAAAAVKPRNNPPRSGGPPKGKSGGFGRLSDEELEVKMGSVQADMTGIDEELAFPETWKDRERAEGLTEKRAELKRELDGLEEEYLKRMR
ncbi:MAG TPA: ABC-F family ATP-binding cassette domain-containing protein, partial [Phycisphaerales bacterium]|nr:ABC-F family ATP-binding cassette domain-containing protein [Phycisphaerales bacterium]